MTLREWIAFPIVLLAFLIVELGEWIGTKLMKLGQSLGGDFE